MVKRALTYILLVLVVLQSAVAMGDTHQLHQSGSEHLVFDDDHLPDAERADNHVHEHDLNSDSSNNQKFDCHHCCHCHGHFSPAIVISPDRVHLAKASPPLPEYRTSTLPENHESLLRPPRA
ncbi:hypothetical protein [Teredinibacter turnerae]|uniref:hypothetical protein n=1 Tax=Teredinibacter turnerae TaxID=2426 RepID=UPI0009B7303F|nr:hypothetical protein [Teredinibacter turnerae]